MIHPLKDWLGRQSPRRTMIWMAEQCAVHVITLRRLCNAEDTVRRELFEKIELVTAGELTAGELYAHYLAQRTGAEGELETHRGAR